MKTHRKCSVCIKEGASYWVEEADQNDLYLKTKLKLIVPEIAWNSTDYLCEACVGDLNVAHRFKQLCLDSLLVLNDIPSNVCGSEKDENYFLSCNVSNESSDFEDDESTIPEKCGYANTEKEESSTNIDILQKICKYENYSERVISSQIESPERRIFVSDHGKLTDESKLVHNCTSCQVSFQTRSDLTKHEKSHMYVCNFCNRSYKRKLILKRHITIKHTEKNSWKHQCCYCDDVFPTKTHLMSHSKRQHTTKEKSLCFHCKDYFTDKNILLDHIIAVHQTTECSPESDYINPNSREANKLPILNCSFPNVEANHVSLKEESRQGHLTQSPEETETLKKRPCRTFSCVTCSKMFGSSVKLIHHCVNEHNVDAKLVRPFACDLCEKRFSTSAILIEHKRYHIKNRQNICSYCGKGFITKNDLNCHEYIHLNARSFKCEICFKGFNTQKNLRTHRIVKHGDPMTWKHCCTICNKRFAILSNYKVHVRRHMGDKQFCCRQCDKKFVNKDELRQHTESHSNIREFKCQYCDKEYKKKRVYEIHLTKNHGIGNAKIPKREKKHICHICPKSYFDRSKLNKHLLSHSGIKPFVCNMCDKKFTDNFYLRQHMKNFHGNLNNCTVPCVGAS